MDQDFTNTDNSQINVTIKAIKNGKLILETTGNETNSEKLTIHWPLSKLPESLELGETLSLKLLNNGHPSGTNNLPLNQSSDSQNTGSQTQNRPPAYDIDQRKKQKLLEDLIN